MVPGPVCLLAAKRRPKGPPPCQVGMQMGKTESSARRRGQGQSSKAIRQDLGRTASQVGDVHLGGHSERQWGGTSWISMGRVTFGGRTHGGWLGLVQGDLCGPHSGKPSPSLLSVCSTVSWGPLGHSHWEFSLGILIGLSFTPTKQRHWTCQAASGFEGHLRTDSVFGTGWGDTGSLLPLPYKEEEDVTPALVTP